MKVLVLDNYDSFTYNLVHLLRELGVDKIDVLRNDRLTLEQAGNYDRILLSPGPGIPSEAGIMPDIIRRLAPSASILGICLGHQCIGEVFGAKLINMQRPVHGLARETGVLDPENRILRGLPQTFMTGRYHSWLVSREDFPECLKITAVDNQGDVMALSHREFNAHGVQFHPESVLTEHGSRILRNWLEG